MTKPSDFILSTDYATLKNDDSDTTSVTAPGAVSVPAAVGPVGGYVEYHQDLTIGTAGAITRLQIESSKNAGVVYAARTLSIDRTGTVGGSPANYSIIAFAYRTAPTTLRCQVYISNPNAGTLTTAAGDETFTFYINTFLAPYST